MHTKKDYQNWYLVVGAAFSTGIRHITFLCSWRQRTKELSCGRQTDTLLMRQILKSPFPIFSIARGSMTLGSMFPVLDFEPFFGLGTNIFHSSCKETFLKSNNSFEYVKLRNYDWISEKLSDNQRETWEIVDYVCNRLPPLGKFFPEYWQQDNAGSSWKTSHCLQWHS